jgi:hypothetical protein
VHEGYHISRGDIPWKCAPAQGLNRPSLLQYEMPLMSQMAQTRRFGPRRLLAVLPDISGRAHCDGDGLRL